jgi:O-methyltransferase involved in polyketide biosynthesis
LIATEFDPDQPSIWVAEGLLVYLSKDEAERLLTSVRDLSARESQLSFDYDTLRHARGMAGMEEVAAMWHGGLGEDPAEWLSEHGWNVETVHRETFARLCRRELLDPTGGFLTATRT